MKKELIVLERRITILFDIISLSKLTKEELCPQKENGLWSLM